MRLEERLIEYEAMLHTSVERVGRAVRNMRQEMGGYASSTPGSGSPGGGKGGRPTVAVDIPAGEPYRLPQHPSDRERWDAENVVPSGADHVPVTSVESQALFGRDEASEALGALRRSAIAVSVGLGRLLLSSGRDPGPEFGDGKPIGADRLVVLGYARIRRVLAPVPVFGDGKQIGQLERPVAEVFHLTQRWGYDPRVPDVPKRRAELLAIDLTESLCRSHLRVGVRVDRSRGELCDWCYRHGPLLVPSWDAPPVEIVRLRVDNGRVYAHQIEPFVKAERERQRQAKARARG